MLKRMMLLVLLLVAAHAQALLVVGDTAGSTTYTSGVDAGAGWDYVGYLQEGNGGIKPSSVTYVSNGWFVTAQHVWDNEVAGSHQETVMLGESSYAINTGSYTSVTNASGSATDLCLFRVTNLTDLPAGMAVREFSPELSSSLRLIGNGYDNDGNSGMTWGNGTPYVSGNGRTRSLVIEELNDTQIYYSVYDSTAEGSALGNTYDSGGGVFIDGQLAGIMIGAGDQVTAIADFGTYGGQINAIAAIPEPSVIVLMGSVPLGAFLVRRIFRV
jgi:hypothetical protein